MYASFGRRSHRALKNAPARHTAALVERLRVAGRAVGDHRAPQEVAVALDDGVRLTVFARLVGEQRRMYAAVDDIGAARPRLAANLVAAVGVGGMNADANDVAGRYG